MCKWSWAPSTTQGCQANWQAWQSMDCKLWITGEYRTTAEESKYVWLNYSHMPDAYLPSNEVFTICRDTSGPPGLCRRVRAPSKTLSAACQLPDGTALWDNWEWLSSRGPSRAIRNGKINCNDHWTVHGWTKQSVDVCHWVLSSFPQQILCPPCLLESMTQENQDLIVSMYNDQPDIGGRATSLASQSASEK